MPGATHSYLLSGILYLALKDNRSQRRKTQGSIEQFPAHTELHGYRAAVKHPLERYSSMEAHRWPDTKRRYLARLETSLRAMVRHAGARRVRVVLMTLPFNYRLSPAFKHPQPQSFNPRHRTAVRAKLREAIQLIDVEDDCPGALKVLGEALRLDPLPALLSYLKGFCLERLGRHAEAERGYAQSRENMIGNLGSVLSVNRIITRVAREERAELLDIKRIFDQYEHKKGVYYNHDLIHDDCHPNPEGHSLIARNLAKVILRSGSR